MRTMSEAAAEGDKSVWSPYFGEFYGACGEKIIKDAVRREREGRSPSKQTTSYALFRRVRCRVPTYDNLEYVVAQSLLHVQSKGPRYHSH